MITPLIILLLLPTFSVAQSSPAVDPIPAPPLAMDNATTSPAPENATILPSPAEGPLNRMSSFLSGLLPSVHNVTPPAGDNSAPAPTTEGPNATSTLKANSEPGAATTIIPPKMLPNSTDLNIGDGGELSLLATSNTTTSLPTSTTTEQPPVPAASTFATNCGMVWVFVAVLVALITLY